MKRLLLTAIFIFLLTDFTQAETLSLSTYYPAPFGVYNQLRLVPLGADPACNANNSGLMWILNASGQLRYCIGGTARVITTTWTQNANSLYPTDIANPALRVGIGTGAAIPAQRLHVLATGPTIMRVEGSVSAPKIEFAQANAAQGYLSTSAAAAINIENNAQVVQMTVTQAGDVGIGIGVPLEKLHVQGNVPAGRVGLLMDNQANSGYSSFLAGSDRTSGVWRNGSAQGAYAGNNSINVGTSGAFNLGLVTNNIVREIINATGNVGIPAAPVNDPIAGSIPTLMVGTGTFPDGNAWVRGHLTVSTTAAIGGTGNVTAHGFFYVSDENSKENIEPVSGLAAIMQLEGVKFNWKGTGKADIGVTAQNVEKVFPEIVNTSSNNLKSVEVGNLVGPLIEAVKEQQHEIEALKKEIEELKSKQF